MSPRAAAAAVVDTAEAFASSGLAAVGQQCLGAVALAHGEGVTALAALRGALDRWRDLDAPYEVARTRVFLAEAYRLLDDDDAALRECAASRAAPSSCSAPRPICGVSCRTGMCRAASPAAKSRSSSSSRSVPATARSASASSSREDRRPPRVEHLHEDRRVVARGGHCLRVLERPRRAGLPVVRRTTHTRREQDAQDGRCRGGAFPY